LGLKVGVLPTGALDAITDVSGVEVGQTTIIRGENIRTGVTAILPHAGNLYREKVPGGIFVGNGFGKLTGSTQVDEMGDIETPILLTSTTSVPRVADATVSYMLAQPGNEDVLSINPVVGETNDGYLNDIRGRHISPEDVLRRSRTQRSDQSTKERSVTALGQLRLCGRVGSGQHRVAYRQTSVDTQYEY
jgi:D-aminopeptidase